MSAAQEILMIRHGMTPGNKLRQYIGRTDEPLSQEGRDALAELHYPNAERVYISPMIRCRQTAEILFPGAELVVYDGLREMDFGHFEGRSAMDMTDDPEYRAWVDAFCEAPIPGGEMKEPFMDRCCSAFEEILASDRTDRLVFVVHGGTLMAVLSRFASPSREYYRWSPKNGHGFLLTREPGSMRLTLREEL